MEDKGKVDILIPLYKDGISRSKGILVDVYKGNLTSIVKRLNSREYDESSGSMGKNDVEQLIMEKDDAGRTPIDLAW